MKRRWRKLGRGKGRKGKGIRPKGRGCRRSLLRRTRAHGKRARAPEGRKGRKTGGEVRSGKNSHFFFLRHRIMCWPGPLLSSFVCSFSHFLFLRHRIHWFFLFFLLTLQLCLSYPSGGTIDPWWLSLLVVREINCGNWLARGYMPAHQHCDLFYPLGFWSDWVYRSTIY